MPTQTSTYSQAGWSLDELFPAHNSPEMKAALADLEAQVAAFEACREQLNPEIAADDFLEIVAELETFTRLAYRVGSFAILKFSENTQDQAALTFQAQIQQRMAALQNRVLFFELWWKELGDGPAERLMAAAGDYAYWLEEMRHFKPHTLSEPEEKIINIKDVTGAQALITLYDAITNRYVYSLEVEGEVKELTREGLMAYVQGPDPDLRARAYQELYRVYEQDAPILGQMYQTLARDWRSEQIDLRHFSSPIAARNLLNDIPDEVDRHPAGCLPAERAALPALLPA